ncbi:hypothetical protein DRF67_10995 [Chryseobacterium pennipullorum]|uniref:Uncharacterized protein n=2 Tax=Chryseobacterium pennipullorum TaxID=2258963 RepID=A0A3D9B1M4_9FLAO|nr:hypothetical protein DRF67_10995 [Chryseobacterium pennipullorum]
MEEFLKYLKSLDSNRQMRMLFMLEAGIYLSDNCDYYTDFGTYPDYQNLGFDKQVRTSFYKQYSKFLFSIPDDMFNKPDEKAKSDWEILKESLLEELNLNREIFEYQYQSFLIGLRLKTMRMCSKKEFSTRSNLSLSKINQIEDYCFLAKVNDIFMYVKNGLGQEFKLDFLRKV